MTTFLIEKRDDYLLDFCNELIIAIKYHNWINNSSDYKYKFSTIDKLKNTNIKSFKKYVPVGSIEFVKEFYKKYYDITLKPINIPNKLKKEAYLLRELYSKPSEIYSDTKYFIKDISDFKKEVDIKIPTIEHFNDGYLISDIMNIISEWRVFVLNDRLIDVKNYAGDPFIVPDAKKIQSMIDDFSGELSSYTLDVAVTECGTAIIEVHQFFSCGLYGFNDYKSLLLMFLRTHLDIINKRFA